MVRRTLSGVAALGLLVAAPSLGAEYDDAQFQPAPSPGQASTAKPNEQRTSELPLLTAEYERLRARALSEGFEALEEELQTALSSAEKGNSTASIELALFYLAHGLAEEAGAALADTEDDAVDKPLAYLRGVIAFERDRFSDAIDIFNQPALRREPIAKIWRGVAYAEVGDYEHAWRDLEKMPSSPRLPQSVVIAAHSARASSGLALGKTDEAQIALRALREFSLSPYERAHRSFLEASLQRALGNDDASRRQFERIKSDGISPFGHLAQIELLRFGLREERLETRDVLNALETLKLHWRGGQFERRVLFQLGEVRFRLGDVAAAFDAWRGLVDAYPRALISHHAARRITAGLATLSASSALPPAVAAEVFYENIDYAPPGAEGDVLIQRIADDLVKLDLTVQAAELLEHQVRKRLRGKQRAIAATRLAEIYLLGGENDKAIEAIRTTRFSGLSKEVLERRFFTEAKALWMTDRTDGALALLEDQASFRLRRLVGDIMLDQQRWAEAAQAYKAATLSSDKADHARVDWETVAIRAAATLMLSEDEAGLIEFQSKLGDDADVIAPFVETTKGDESALLAWLSTLGGEV